MLLWLDPFNSLVTDRVLSFVFRYGLPTVLLFEELLRPKCTKTFYLLETWALCKITNAKVFPDTSDFSPVFLVIVLSVLLSEAVPSLRRRELWSVLLVSVLALTLVLAVVIIWRQPQSTTKAAFMVNWWGDGGGQDFMHPEDLQFQKGYLVRWVS